MIDVVQANDVYLVSFRYDPKVVELIKNVPGRKWVPECKYWTIPKNNLGMLINQFKGTVYEGSLNIKSNEQLGINATLDTTNIIPNIDLKNIPFYVKTGAYPFKHQLDFMKYAIDRERNKLMSGFILADEPGLGKSAEVMNLALFNRSKLKYKHCLIICCISNSRYNWVYDVMEHTQGRETPYIIGTRKKRDGSIIVENDNSCRLEDLKTMHMYGDKKAPKLPYFLLLNIEAIRYCVSGNKFPIANEICKLIDSGSINMVAIDEIHKNVSPHAIQGKQLLRIKKATGSKVMWIPMTGTPIINKPTDVYLPLKLIDGHSFNSFYSWCNEFCVYGGYGHHEIIGYKNIPKLKSMLQNNMLRRCKADVLDLPPKIYYTEYVENTAYQDALYSKVANEIASQKDEILLGLNPLSKFMRLRQVNGSPEIVDLKLNVDDKYFNKVAKLQRLMELLEEIHERNEKVIIYSNWVEPLRTLYKYVSKKYNVCCFTGTMSDSERQKHKQAFQNDPKYTVMMGTIAALGTTHTLTAASDIIFYDEPWTPADKAQAEDRAHRIGTTQPLTIYTLICKDTIDDRVHDIIYTKRGISNYIIDNKLDLKNDPKLFDLLLKRG